MSTITEYQSMVFSKPNDTQILATRIIDAPRQLVWAAHTQCDHVQHWLLGPQGWTMPVCEIDLRPGGAWRYVYEGPDGDGFQMSGEYLEVIRLERLVNTETMDDAPVETLNTLTMEEDEQGRTIVKTVVEYPSTQMREDLIATGMLDGWAESYTRMEEYLRTLK